MLLLSQVLLDMHIGSTMWFMNIQTQPSSGAAILLPELSLHCCPQRFLQIMQLQSLQLGLVQILLLESCLTVKIVTSAHQENT